MGDGKYFFIFIFPNPCSIVLIHRMSVVSTEISKSDAPQMSENGKSIEGQSVSTPAVPEEKDSQPPADVETSQSIVNEVLADTGKENNAEDQSPSTPVVPEEKDSQSPADDEISQSIGNEVTADTENGSRAEDQSPSSPGAPDIKDVVIPRKKREGAKVASSNRKSVRLNKDQQCYQCKKMFGKHTPDFQKGRTLQTNRQKNWYCYPCSLLVKKRKSKQKK